MSITADLEDVFGLIRRLARTVLSGDTLADFEAALAAFEGGHPAHAGADVAEGVADELEPGVDGPTGAAPAPATPIEA